MPEPTVFRLSSHYTNTGSRLFVLLNESAPEGLEWTRLAPMSYDGTEIADAFQFTSPVTMTLVGPSGTRVVSSTKHVFLSKSWDFDKASGALEVDAGDKESFSIALSGSHAKAEWKELRTTPSERVERWVAQQGIELLDKSAIYASWVQGTYVQTITVFDKAGKMRTLVRMGNKLMQTLDGNVLGAVTVDGQTKLVVAEGNRTWTTAI